MSPHQRQVFEQMGFSPCMWRVVQRTGHAEQLHAWAQTPLRAGPDARLHITDLQALGPLPAPGPPPRGQGCRPQSPSRHRVRGHLERGGHSWIVVPRQYGSRLPEHYRKEREGVGTLAGTATTTQASEL